MVPRVGISYWDTGGNPRKQAVFERLREWCELDVLDPEREHPELAAGEYDLYHMAKRRHASLLDLQRAATAGSRVLNAPHAARITSDRVARLSRLESAGVPLPAYQYGRADAIDLEPPVVVKPRFEFGEGAHDFSFVTDGPIAFDGPRLVERYLDYDRAYKLYVLGERCRAVEVTDEWMERPPPPAVTEILASVRSRFDLSVFEIDVIRTDGELSVLDVNPAVSLRGLDDGASLYNELLRTHCPVSLKRSTSDRSTSSTS
jgi:glutathione synthase/RimK-type ligase-like ATP-grasp enzyme